MIWKQVRFQGMPAQQAHALLGHLRKLDLVRVPIKAKLSAILKIGLTHQLAAYDSSYIALALHYGYALITIDQVQSRAATLEGVTLKPITDFR